MVDDVDETAVLVSLMSPRSVARGEMRFENDCNFGTQASILKVISKNLSSQHVSIVDME